MTEIPHATPAAVKLWHDGAQVLAEISAAGMRIDVPYLDRTIAEVGAQIKALEADLREWEEYKAQRRRFGEATKLGSRQQLAYVLFGQGHTHCDEAQLQAVGTPYCKDYLRLAKLEKLHGTYLTGVRREVVDGLLHPNFNLHNVTTFRGSGSNPNFQNIPIRDKEMGKLIRRAFVPRPGRVLLEMDLAANEVRVAAAYHRDPTMVKYLLDGFDLHTDMARQCYLLPAAMKPPKEVRYLAKGNFVFAAFYGSYYVDIARSLWDESADLKLDDGTPVHDWLRSRGITGRGACKKGERQEPAAGTFEAHIKKVEDHFWGKRFPVYDKWRRDWFAAYERQGWFQMLTGFVVQGVYKRNEVINSPVQGAAFHCLLWGLVRLHKWLRRNRMQSQIIGQIHDSLLIDTAENELEGVAAELNRILVHDIRQEYDWLICPLATEAEVGRENWYEKKAWEPGVAA